MPTPAPPGIVLTSKYGTRSSVRSIDCTSTVLILDRRAGSDHREAAVRMYSQPLAEAIAEAEKLVAAAPFIEIRGRPARGPAVPRRLHRRAAPTWRSTTTVTTRSCTAAPGRSPRWASTTPTPCTSAPGCRPGTSTSSPGRAAPPPTSASSCWAASTPTTTCPTARRRSTTASSTSPPTARFEWRFTPATPAQLVIREVYNDWSARRGHLRDRAHRHRGHGAARA